MVARILLAHSFPGPDSMAQGRCSLHSISAHSGALLRVSPRSGRGLCTCGFFFAPSQCWKENQSFKQPHMRHSQHLRFRECGKGHGEGHILRFRPCLLLLPNCHSLSSHYIGWFPASWKPWSHQLHPGPVFFLLWKHLSNRESS